MSRNISNKSQSPNFLKSQYNCLLNRNEVPHNNLIIINCPMCGGGEAKKILQKDGFNIVLCGSCSLIYVNPRLSTDVLAEMYNGQLISRTDYYIETSVTDEVSFRRRLQFIERHRSPGKLLDIGCGPGTFMAVAKKRGWSVYGIDVNAASIEYCHKKGLRAVVGKFPNPILSGDMFDAVIMNDVIEHLPDPRRALAEARALLSLGGVLFLSTPDIGAIIARLSGNRWLHLKPTEHLTYFNRRNLLQLLSEVGFKTICCYSVGRNRSLSTIIDRMTTYSNILSRVTRAAVPGYITQRIHFPVNLGDEMGVLAMRD